MNVAIQSSSGHQLSTNKAYCLRNTLEEKLEVQMCCRLTDSSKALSLSGVSSSKKIALTMIHQSVVYVT